MLSPSTFEIDEAWALYRLNKSPMREEPWGEFDLITLVDAASGDELGREWFSLTAKGTWVAKPRDLLQNAARLRGNRLPKTIFVTKGVLDEFIRPEAIRQGIRVNAVPEYELNDIATGRREASAWLAEEDLRR